MCVDVDVHLHMCEVFPPKLKRVAVCLYVIILFMCVLCRHIMSVCASLYVNFTVLSIEHDLNGHLLFTFLLVMNVVGPSGQTQPISSCGPGCIGAIIGTILGALLLAGIITAIIVGCLLCNPRTWFKHKGVFTSGDQQVRYSKYMGSYPQKGI